jgi:thiamine-monophosphate kinase
MLSITVLGTVTRGQALRRDRLRVGDDLYLTGQLGGSALALARSERARSVMRWIPEPRLKAGQALAGFKGHGACIDVSDGLIPDLERLLDASGVGAEIDAKSIPMPRGYRAACDRLGLDANSLSLAGGEDYELLFSLRSQVSKQISVKGLSHRLGVEVTRIGSVTRRLGIVGLPSVSGFRHY